MSLPPNEENLLVRHEKGETSGRYLIDLAPGIVAEMTYQRTGPNTILIDHTRVPPEYRGKNIAEKLMGHVIDDARKNGSKIIPVCSYVVAQFKRHPNWSDLLSAQYKAPEQL